MIENMSEHTVEQKVVLIMKEKLKINDELITEEYKDVPLTWRPFNFSAIQLMYLLLEIEKAFGIQIAEQCLSDYGFSTIEKIINIVISCKATCTAKVI